ncbi:hypothetical protein GCM10028799_42820 [Kribbella italica]
MSSTALTSAPAVISRRAVATSFFQAAAMSWWSSSVGMEGLGVVVGGVVVGGGVVGDAASVVEQPVAAIRMTAAADSARVSFIGAAGSA